MAIEEYDGVIINKVTLVKYKELKAANQIITSQTYVITDLDDYLDLDNEAYWQVRTGRVIGNGEVLFFNTNKTNFSDVPLGNLFLQEEESGSSYYLKFLQENGMYKLVWYNTDGVYTSSDVIAYGYSIAQMIWNNNNSHALYTHTLVGDYAKISQVISDTTIIDSLCRLNNTNF